MNYVRVLHIPSHMTYAHGLCRTDFGPVTAPGQPGIGIGELLRYQSWEFFDVLHLHTVELTSHDELDSLTSSLRQLDKRLVMTVHDLAPNIETDVVEHDRKLATAVAAADAVITLTDESARQIPGDAGPVGVIPHGRTIQDGAIPERSIASSNGPLATFGALRPNRDLRSLLSAWKQLGAVRPGLRLLLRSVGRADETRDSSLLAYLRSAARHDPKLTLGIEPAMLPDADLVAWLRGCSALVLPYSGITHSGQLELACDVGLPAVAPDLPTLRDQLRLNHRENLPVTWFPTQDMNSTRFTAQLQQATQLCEEGTSNQASWRAWRWHEKSRVLEAHAVAYGVSARR